jgi:hypothetical protein
MTCEHIGSPDPRQDRRRERQRACDKDYLLATNRSSVSVQMCKLEGWVLACHQEGGDHV